MLVIIRIYRIGGIFRISLRQLALFAITANPAKRLAAARVSQNQDFQDWRDLQDFTLAQITLFAITANPAKTSADERLPLEDATDESCKSYNPENPDSDKYARRTNPANPIILKILILTKLPPVIPAKAGIHTVSAKPATQNQVQIASDKSLPPLWGKARMNARRAQARTAGDKVLPFANFPHRERPRVWYDIVISQRFILGDDASDKNPKRRARYDTRGGVPLGDERGVRRRRIRVRPLGAR